MKKTKLQPKMGDIILAHNYMTIGWWVRIMTKSYWNHCCLYIGKGKVIDILARGIRVLDYNKYYKDKIDHKFIRVKGLSDYDRKKLCSHALKFVGKKYNTWLIFGIYNTKGAFTCSEFVGKVFADNGIILAPELLTNSPADFDRSLKTYDLENPPNRQKGLKALKDIIKKEMTRYEISLGELIDLVNKEEKE
jgi:hypothetical protein